MELSLSDLLRAFGLPLLFIIIFLENTILGFFIPGEIILFAAAALAGQGTLNVFLVFIVAFVAALSGNVFGFYIGFKVGIPALKKIAKKLHTERLLDRSNEFFKKYGAASIILGRFAVGVRVFIPPLAGASNMRFSLFLLYTIIALLIWTFVITGLGFYFSQDIAFLVANYNIAGAVILVIIISIFIIIYLRKKWRERKNTDKSE